MKTYDRRSFLKSSAAVAAGTWVLPRFSIGKAGPAANSRLNVAMIGAGGIAGMAYQGCKGENIVALADVDEATLLGQAKRHPEVENARHFRDFRVMLDKMGTAIDAVCVNTPDHTHFVATMEALRRGKHVFTQKPLTHNVWQARTLRRAMHRYGVVTNMGNQGHTYDGIRRMREWVEAGVFGQIREVHSWSSGPNWHGTYFAKPEGFPPLPVDPVPPTLDYNLWLGPVPKVPYNKYYHPRKWRGFNRFGSGTLGDWFCHIADGPVWVLDLYQPTIIEAEEVRGRNDILAPEGCRVRYEFPQRGDKAPCTFYWHNGPGFLPQLREGWDWVKKMPGAGTLWIGEKAVGYTNARSDAPRLVNIEQMKAFNKAGLPAARYPRVEGGPVKEFCRAAKGEGPLPGANFDYAAPMTEVMLLGVIAVQHGGRLEWDAEQMRFPNRPELNAHLSEPVRPGWEYGRDLWQG